MEEEIHNFIKVWATIFLSLSFCHYMAKITPKGPTRLIFIAPTIGLFLCLPLRLHTVHLGGMTSFFIAWLANFKLLLFAFGRGPLSPPPSSYPISLPHFIAIACLPLKVSPSPKVDENRVRPPPEKKSPLNYVAKAAIYVSLSWVYDWGAHLHPKFILFVYFLHIYCFLDVSLTVFGAVARVAIGSGLEPPFNEPYLSTSLQDFWGRRWNLTVSSILRPAVYDPALALLEGVLGLRWARLAGIWATFVVSALMHELMFFYLGRQRPTWEITWFFILHGACLMAEVGVKKAAEHGGVTWRPPRVAANVATVAFVLATGFWLFFPQLIRCGVDVRGIEEYEAAGAFVRGFFRERFSAARWTVGI
ncbi:unnamed protein product [Linum trigynum]|uniref:Wax synthase domain-containing protein n=1 Tax=Linum trigynum TaxID=586398 RepID=A0AAV2EIY8_9ROSI